MSELLPKQASTAQTMRFIGNIEGKVKGPTLIFFGGIHGNEPAGVQALDQVFSKLNDARPAIKGSIFGIRGNVPAILQNQRYLDNDLNRLWTSQGITGIKKKDALNLNSEEIELLEIMHTLDELLRNQSPPFYFIDFHTTSSKTLPFITINDALINRKFSKQFPVPIILGIEEYLEGPLLSRMNQLGYVSLGFESGQHNDIQAVENSVAFFWLTLVFANVLSQVQLADFEQQYERLNKSAQQNKNFYEVVYRHALHSQDKFTMLPGFKSFQKVAKGTPLGAHNNNEILAKSHSILFMPLYQDQGAEGFFLIKRISAWALNLSSILRKMKIDRLLVLLPGISWNSHKKGALLVNLLIARFFTKSFFHLLGYRSKVKDETHILMYNRELRAKNRMYRNERWY